MRDSSSFMVLNGTGNLSHLSISSKGAPKTLEDKVCIQIGDLVLHTLHLPECQSQEWEVLIQTAVI